MLIIGIAGGSGSGKTAITNRLKEHFGSSVTVISHDSYYRSTSALTEKERAGLNYDHPNAFDTQLLAEHIKTLLQGREVDIPVYDYKTHQRLSCTQRIEPSEVLIVEGILIFENEELCSLFDIKIYVDTDADIRLARRIRRDVSERGRSLDSVLEQYIATVKPMHDCFVEPTKKRADIIICEGASNSVALDMLISRIGNSITRQGK